PCLERYSSCDEAELSLTRLEQFYVLYGPFSGQPHNRKIEGPGQNLRQPLAIDVVSAARRCRPDEELIWPVRLPGAGRCRPQEGRRNKECKPKPMGLHGSPPICAPQTGSTFSGASASKSVSRSRCSRIRCSSSEYSHFDTTMVATPFPMRLVSARA